MKLALRTIGDGKRTAALVHGASATGDIWRDFAKILVEKYDITVILMDQRGHGSSPHAESYRTADFVGDLVESLPIGLDFLIGQSLGGRAAALAAPSLLPKRFIGLDPAFEGSAMTGFLIATFGRLQTRMPDWMLAALGSPPKGAAPDTLARFRAAWKTWDPSMMEQLRKDVRSTEWVIGPPAVPSTLVLADKSLVVSTKTVAALRALGWDIRIKPGAVHDLHVQDPAGVIAILDDVLRDNR